MPKNKGKHRSERQIEPAAELQSATWRLFAAMRPHAIKITAVLLGVIVVIVGFGVWNWQARERAGKASDVYGEATDVLQAKIMSDDSTESTLDSEEITYPSYKDRNEGALAVLARMQRDHDKAPVTHHANLLRAGVLYDLARYDEAIDAYRDYLARSASHDPLAFIAQEGLGYAMEAKALASADPKERESGLGDALRSFQRLGAGDDDDFYDDYSLYHQARIKATLGDREAAAKLYDELLKKFPTSTLRSSAEAHKALLEG